MKGIEMMMTAAMCLASLLCGCMSEKESPTTPAVTATGVYETRESHVDREGMDIYGMAHIPSGVEGKMPAVILSHELGATLDRVKGYGEALAEAGYVTVCFDFCGGGYGSRSDGNVLDMSVLTEKADLEAVLEEVRGWDFVDVDSIYLMGNSQGGVVTAMTAAEHRDEIRAVILIYPGFSLYDNVHAMFESPEEVPETHSLLGMRLGQRYFVDIWDQEPYGLIREYGKDILLIHGSRDSIIPIAYSDRLAETIENVEYHVIQDADHGFLGEDFALAVSYITNFLNSAQTGGEAA